MVSGPSRRGDTGFAVLVIVGPLKKIVIEPEGGARVFLREKNIFLPPSILSRICFSFLYHKIVRPASSDSQNRSHNLPERFEGKMTAVFLFFFYFLF